jgi:hypothetical protein
LNVEDGSTRQGKLLLDAQTNSPPPSPAETLVSISPRQRRSKEPKLTSEPRVAASFVSFPFTASRSKRFLLRCSELGGKEEAGDSIQKRSIFLCVLCSVFSVVNAIPANRTRSLGLRDQISVRLLDLSSFCEYRIALHACNSQINTDSGLS